MKILLHSHVQAIFLWFSSNKIRKDLIFYFLSEEPRVLNILRFLVLPIWEMAKLLAY